MAQKITKKWYEEYINEVPVPERDRQSNGGDIPDNALWGTWLRKHDPLSFEIGYEEYKENAKYLP